MQYASRVNRFFGQFIDGIITSIPVIVGLVVAGILPGDLIWALVGVVISAAYLFLADGFENGQSLGKKWLGMRVIDERSGAACSYGQSFVRNLLLSILGPIDWIFIFGDKHQRLGDKAAGTVVVPTR